MIEAEANQEAENYQENKMNSKVKMPAGVKTSYEDDKNRFQRRHFSNSMSSDIFFSAVPSNNIKTPENNADQDNLCMSAKDETHNADQEESENQNSDASSENPETPENSADEDYSSNLVDESEKPHTDASSENSETPAENADQDEQVDSADANQKKTQRRHFHDKNTSSRIFGDGSWF